MSDPNWYFEAMKNAGIAALHVARIAALTEQADQERARRALMEQFYGPALLEANGICPSCLYPIGEDCQCEDAADVE